MATPFPFVAGTVLTASALNSITELVINDKTDSYTLVAGDAGEYVVMNKATSSTITVPNSVFTAGQIVRIINKGAGVCTVTAGAGTTVSSTGTLALAQNATGTLIALSASAFIFEAGGVTQSAGGLVYLTGASFSAVTSVSLPNSTFTSTYRNYRVIVQISNVASTTRGTIRLRASGSDNTTANYRSAILGYTDGGSTDNATSQGTSSWLGIGANTSTAATLSFDLSAPQVAQQTQIVGVMQYSNAASGSILATLSGNFTATTQFDALSFIFAGNTDGTYRVYGYADS